MRVFGTAVVVAIVDPPIKKPAGSVERAAGGIP
jgi:hypothetical protein